MSIDLTPTARAVTAVVSGITDEQLAHPTPCSATTVAALLDHLHGLARAFQLAAEKDPEAADTTANPVAEHLVPDWRSAIPARLDALAAAWRDPAAWAGTARAGGLEMPAEVAGTVALDELVLHGWDLAVATGQRFEPDDDAVAAVLAFTEATAAGGPTEGLFGPPVAVPDRAPAFERALGFSGRDPRWTPVTAA